MGSRVARRALAAVGVSAWAWVGSGCTVHVFSPPAHAADLQSAATLQEGQLSLGGAVGLQTSEIGLDDGPSARTIQGHVGFGVAERFELRGSFQHLQIYGDDRLRGRADPNVLAGHLGLKAQLTPYYSQAPFVLSTELGFGGGRSDVGGFIAPDITLLLSWENPYVVPFTTLRYSPSVPLDTDEPPLDLSALDGDDDAISRLSPILTHMIRYTVGARAIIPTTRVRDDFGRPLSSIDLLVAMVLTDVRDGDEQLTFLGFIAAVEIRLPSVLGSPQVGPVDPIPSGRPPED